MNTSEQSAEQRLEAFKMCMAEAGYPVTDVHSASFLGRDEFSWDPGDRRYGSDVGYWLAVYRATALIGAYEDSRSHWCAAHFAEFKAAHPFDYLPDECPCNTGTSGYEQGGA